jgi:Spy/CpxP family protein refolding chaperone
MQEAPMENSLSGKWKIRAVVVGVFVLGYLAGALSMNAYRAQFSRFPREPRGDRFEQMLDRLKLTADQRTQVEQIMKESRSQIVEIRRQSEPRYKEIRNQTEERLQTVLSPQQWQQWQQMTQEMRGRRSRGFGPQR